MVLMLLTFCSLLLPLRESVTVLCFVVRYFMSILVLQSSWWGRESWLLCLICLPGVSWWLSGSSSRCHGVVCSLWLWYFLIILTYYFCNIDSSLVKMAHPEITCFYIVIWNLINSKSLWLEMNIQVSKLSIYMEEDIKYVTPKMIIFNVFFIIKHLFLCVKQKSLRDVSFTHQTHVFIDSY